ncbi:hypothetical protein ACFV4G_25420 [Kitasatospora sp. NPDC059747]|uniref:hypothetical protein n=1 Tax=Kitasatospora sp. NPDC059747 TaxID=3346930 RepID=UPI00364D4757
MRTSLHDRRPDRADEFEEQASPLSADEQLPEFLRELFVGRAGESDTERAVRVDAARGILADLREDEPELVAYVAELLLDAATFVTRCADCRSFRPGRAA